LPAVNIIHHFSAPIFLPFFISSRKAVKAEKWGQKNNNKILMNKFYRQCGFSQDHGVVLFVSWDRFHRAASRNQSVKDLELAQRSAEIAEKTFTSFLYSATSAISARDLVA
jgi:hypothetical protein